MAWTDMGNGGSSGAWLQNGNNVYTNNIVGINTATPQTTLDIKGDGFLVSQKTKLNANDPNNHQYNMPLSDVLYSDMSGILYDPSGPNANYPSGNINTTTTLWVGLCTRGSPQGCNNVGIKLTFEVFDTEANGDSIIISDGTNILAKYSGNILPPDLFFNGQTLLIRFKTNGNSTVGQGFKIKWQAIEKDGTSPPITSVVGNSAYFETSTGAFRSGNMGQNLPQNAGIYSVGMGYDTKANGYYSIALGQGIVSSGLASVALGSQTKATADFSTTTGVGTNATAQYATAMGYYTNASSTASFASGYQTISGGYASTAMGYSTKASGDYSTSMGRGSNASGYVSTALGYNTSSSGNYSTAMGISTVASGYTSTAFGNNTNASGTSSTAMGNGTIASGFASIALGMYNKASGDYSTAMGLYSIASSTASFASGYQTISGGYASTSMGNTTNASGSSSTAMGSGTIASGINSTAMGYSNTANGSYSTAMGSNVNAYYEGSFVIGDSPNNSNLLYSQNSNSFNSRFRNGYNLYTSASLNSGVILYGNSNSWSSISDSTKKENFLPIDGENVLKKIAKMKTVTWNYKGQDPKNFRHYGPMAQEFFSAFGRDKLGVIGNDTTIASADFDGVNFTAIKALEKRTSELQTENESLKKRLAILEKSSSEILGLKAEMEQLKAFLIPEKEKITVQKISDK